MTPPEPSFTLPISPDYVAHWGLWEAIRELLQNAMDQQDSSGVPYSVDYFAETQTLTITSAGGLAPSTLVLGNTSKNGKTSRGKFGEGYKLALLVLTRLGHEVTVLTGSARWTVALEHSETFGVHVLAIRSEQLDAIDNKVSFVVRGIPEDEWNYLQRNFIDAPAQSCILYEETEAGRIYVGGLFVCTMKDFECGYSFATGAITLDRDRGMVNSFDLSYATSAIWAAHRDDEKAVELIEKDAADVKYIDSRASVSYSYTPSPWHSHRVDLDELPADTSPVVIKAHQAFVAKHGEDAVPVTTQEEVERASASGKKWVLVKEGMKKLLSRLRSFVIPSTKSPADRLSDVIDKHGWNLPDHALQELKDILAIIRASTTLS